MKVIRRTLLCLLGLLCALTARAEVELQRTVSDVMNADGTRRVTYRVENTGTENVTDIKVTDLGTQTALIKALEPGAYEVFTADALASDSTVSAPTLEWTENGVICTASCEGVSIPVISAAIKISAAVDAAEAARGDEITLHVYIRNSGSVPVGDVAITDQSMGLIASVRGPIDPGETVECLKTFIISDDTEITLHAEGVSTAGGAVSASSNTVTVTAADSAFEGEQLTVTAFDAGGGSAEITVTNIGQVLTDVDVGLLSGGDTYTLAVLGREQVTVTVKNAPEGETRAYARRTDEVEGCVCVLSAEFTVTGTAEISEPLVHGRLIATGGEGIYPALLGAGSVTVALLALILHVSRERFKNAEKREKRHRDQARSLLRAEAREEMAKTKHIKVKGSK